MILLGQILLALSLQILRSIFVAKVAFHECSFRKYYWHYSELYLWQKSAINTFQNNVNSTAQRKIREKWPTSNGTNLQLSGMGFNLIIPVNCLLLETV